MNLLVIELAQGPDQGLRATLRDGQTLRVGSSAWADMTCPHDSDLQDVHFSITTQQQRWQVQALGAESLLYLNGRPIQQGELQHGDELTAGNSHFQLRDPSRPLPTRNTAPATQEETDDSAEETPAATDYLAELGIAPPASADDDSPAALATALHQQGRSPEAIRLIAAAAGCSTAVQWTLAGPAALGVDPLPEDLTTLAQGWLDDPAEENRRAAEAWLNSHPTDNAARWIAQAIFWSGGSIAAADLPELAPSPWLYTAAIQAAWIKLATSPPAGDLNARWQTIVDTGVAKLG